MTDDTDADYVRYDAEKGEVYLTDDAPDELIEQAQEEHEKFEAVVNFALTVARDDSAGGIEDHRIFDADDLSELHYAKVDEAVDNGDIEAAQEHKRFAELYQQYYRKYLYGWEDE